MLPETRTFAVDGVTYRLRTNDMNYYAKMEELTGYRENAIVGVHVNASNVLAILYAAIWAEFAARDAEPSITVQQLGARINTDALRQQAVDVVAEILGLNLPKPEDATPADPPAAPAKRSRSRGATKSARSTSASPSASSGG